MKLPPLKALPNGFTRSHNQRCPDCEDRGALDNMGRPVFRNGVRLSFGCEGCGGSGRVPLPRDGKTDPYFTGVW